MAAINTKVKKAVIPVAGLGTRMLPATKAIPKEMLRMLKPETKKPDSYLLTGGEAATCR